MEAGEYGWGACVSDGCGLVVSGFAVGPFFCMTPLGEAPLGRLKQWICHQLLTSY